MAIKKWKCPECGATGTIRWIRHAIIEEYIQTTNGCFEYAGDQLKEYGDGPYVCGYCDYTIPVKTREELYKYLEDK